MTAFELAGKVRLGAGPASPISCYSGHLAGTHHGDAVGGQAGQQLRTDMTMIGGGRHLRPPVRGWMLSLTWVWDGLYTSFFTPA